MSTQRKATPRGQMSSSQNSGPAVMLMPPEIRSTFMPNPPLEPLPSISYKRRNKWTGVAQYMVNMEKTLPPERIILPTPKSIGEERKKMKLEQHRQSLIPLIEQFRAEQKACGGEYKNMNCYNTLFIGRLAYEVTERKLLREMEALGPVKDIHIIKRRDDPSKSCGYAFVEYEHEDDMKRAYRAMDGVKIDGREIVVDVERGHTVPDFLPRRLGGGLGGTRLGGREMNVTRPGRFDPNRIIPKENHVLPPPSAFPMMNSSSGMGRGGGMGGGGPSVAPYGPGPVYGGPPVPPPNMQSGPMPYGDVSREPDRYGGGPPRDSREWGDRSRSRDHEGYDRSKRRRSGSPPDQRYGGGGGSRRPRY